MDDLQSIQSDAVRAAAAEALQAEGHGDWIPSRALLVCEALDRNGGERILIIPTNDLRLTDIVGFARFAERQAWERMDDGFDS